MFELEALPENEVMLVNCWLPRSNMTRELLIGQVSPEQTAGHPSAALGKRRTAAYSRNTRAIWFDQP